MTKAHQIALVGCGDVAHRDYLPEFYRLSERAELVGVCGLSRARAERTAAEYGITHVFDDLPDLLANTERELRDLGLDVRGVMGYEGHLMMVHDRDTKREKVQAMTTSSTAATPALSHNKAS